MPRAAVPPGLAAFLGGLVGGAVIGAAMRAAETSRIAFGPYALYGNGAFAIPAVLVPVAIYVLWALLLRTKAPGQSPIAAMTLAVVALDLSMGLSYRAVQEGGLPGFDPGVILGSAVFVVPTALFAGFALWVLRILLRGNVRALALLFVGGAVLALVPPFVFFGGIGTMGVSAGAGVAAAERADRGGVILIGIALAVLAFAQSFALPLLFAPVRG